MLSVQHAYQVGIQGNILLHVRYYCLKHARHILNKMNGENTAKYNV